jgi:hypothetical protein
MIEKVVTPGKLHIIVSYPDAPAIIAKLRGELSRLRSVKTK